MWVLVEAASDIDDSDVGGASSVYEFVDDSGMKSEKESESELDSELKLVIYAVKFPVTGRVKKNRSQEQRKMTEKKFSRNVLIRATGLACG